MNKHKFVSIFLLLATLVCAASANADFIGSYDVSNWTTTVTPIGSDASVDTIGAPLSVTLISGDNGSGVPSTVDFTIAAVAGAQVFFHWDYDTLDIDPSFDPFGYLLNGTFTQLTTNGIFIPQSGDALFTVNTGDIFGFRQASVDSTFGSGVTTVSRFTVTAVPEPATLVLVFIGVLGFLGDDWRRRKRLIS